MDHPQSSLHLHPSVLGMICDFVERGEGGGSTAQDFPFKQGDIVVGGWWLNDKKIESSCPTPPTTDDRQLLHYIERPHIHGEWVGG